MKQKSKIIEVNDWRDQGRSWWTAESRAMAWKYWYLMPLSLFWGPLPQQLVLRLQLGLRKSQKPGQKDGENIMFFFFFSELSKIYDAKVGGPELEVWHYGGCLESPDPPRSDCWPCPRNKGKKLNRKKKKVLRHKKEYFRFCGFHFGNICSQPTHVFSWGSKGLSWGHMSLWQGQARNSSVASWWQLTANV